MKTYILQNKHYNDLNPVDFGYEHCKANKSFGPHIREYFLLHFVVSGEGKFYCDNRSYNLKAGQFFVIRPNEITKYKADKKNPWYYIWIGFTGKIAENCSFLKERVHNYDGNTFYEMLEIEDYNNSKEEFLLSKLLLLICEFSHNKTNVSKYVIATKNYVLTNYMNDINLTKIAKNIGVDRSYLSKLFKAEMNITFQKYLSSVRFKKATEFLKKGYNVNEVAIMCGYKEACSFSRAYKNYCKTSPIHIKKEVI